MCNVGATPAEFGKVAAIARLRLDRRGVVLLVRADKLALLAVAKVKRREHAIGVAVRLAQIRVLRHRKNRVEPVVRRDAADVLSRQTTRARRIDDARRQTLVFDKVIFKTKTQQEIIHLPPPPTPLPHAPITSSRDNDAAARVAKRTTAQRAIASSFCFDTRLGAMTLLAAAFFLAVARCQYQFAPGVSSVKTLQVCVCGR
jgi:hypothetical protein